MNTLDNKKAAFKALYYLLRLLNVPVTDSTLKNLLESHYDFPSLLSLCDVLDELKITNMATQISVDIIDKMPVPSIVFINIHGGIFVPIRKNLNKKIEWRHPTNGWKQDKYETFTQIWNGITLLVDINPNSGEENFNSKRLTGLILSGLKYTIICSLVFYLFPLIFSPYLIFKLSSINIIAIFLYALTIILLCKKSSKYFWGLDEKNYYDSEYYHQIFYEKTLIKFLKSNIYLFIIEIIIVSNFYYIILILVNTKFRSDEILTYIIIINSLLLSFLLYLNIKIKHKKNVVIYYCFFINIIGILLLVTEFKQFHISKTAFNIAFFGITFVIALWYLIRSYQFQNIRAIILQESQRKLIFSEDFIHNITKGRITLPPIFSGMKILLVGKVSAKNNITFIIDSFKHLDNIYYETLKCIKHNDNTNFKIVPVFSVDELEQFALQGAKTIGVKTNDLNDFVNFWAKVSTKQNIKNKMLQNINEQEDTVYLTLEIHSRWCELANAGSFAIFLNGRKLPNAVVVQDILYLCSYIEKL